MQYLRVLRPQQWLKNFLIFVPIFFAREIFVKDKLELAFFAFISFCAAASSVYVFNDLVDKKNDAMHPVKKNRPIASGKVSFIGAILLIIILLLVSFGLAFLRVPQIVWLIFSYILINILYSFYLKHVAILDIVLISSFYLLRVEIGGFATSTPLSRWLILCVIFSSLLLIVGKRFAEFKHEYRRSVLAYYNESLLNQLLSLSAGLALVAYGLYSILGVSSSLAVYSVFFVILGVGRYLFLVYNSPEAEYPEKIIFKDKIILLSFCIWVIYMFLIFYK